MTISVKNLAYSINNLHRPEHVAFVNSLLYGSEKTPITLQDAQTNIAEWKKDGVEVPAGLTAEIYTTLWNQFIK